MTGGLLSENTCLYAFKPAPDDRQIPDHTALHHHSWEEMQAPTILYADAAEASRCVPSPSFIVFEN